MKIENEGGSIGSWAAFVSRLYVRCFRKDNNLLRYLFLIRLHLLRGVDATQTCPPKDGFPKMVGSREPGPGESCM